MSHTDASAIRQTTVNALCRALEAADASGAVPSIASSLWLQRQLIDVSPSSLPTAFSLAGRKFGERTVQLEGAPLSTPQLGWSTALCARLALLLRFALVHPAEAQRALARELYYKGDSAEKCAVLRCLALLDEPEQLVLVATDGIRSHVQPVFEAIACENPYASRHLDDAAFNQLVMKAFFTGVAVRRIHGLPRRLNPELHRMALDFEAERLAAGRPVPCDLNEVTAPAPLNLSP